MHDFSLRKGGLYLAPALAVVLLIAGPARAHHLIDINGLTPTLLNGLLSGLAHPVIGPDHLLFLLALAVVGLRQRGQWMLLLLGVGLVGSAAGLIGPGLPGAELLVSLTLVLEALVLLDRLPKAVLLPAMALHGYVLSASVLGWSQMPLLSYLGGLMVSQSVLLLVALTLLQPAALRLRLVGRRLVAALLVGAGSMLALSQALA
ncbi:MAG: HupE/UreJ family protein [Cyanobacteriota bacterium]|nr:HupE/UreJ family protein [Cyanobacteriota bacterium]